jgi:hypothetical protein
VSVTLERKRLSELNDACVNEVWTRVHDAWIAWSEDYDAEAPPARVPAEQLVPACPSPARTQQTIREELKQQAIEMLFGDTFDGLPRASLRVGEPDVRHAP